MRILLSVTYYWPHISGLTLAMKRLGEDFCARGHEVTVIAGQHDPALPAGETVEGVRVLRVPLVAKIGKALVMPGLFVAAWRAAGEADVVNLWLPQADAGLVALAARLRGRPVVLTYVCSLTVPGRFGRLIKAGVSLSHLAAGVMASRIVALSEDYAGQSRFCRLFRRKLAFIDLPIPNLDPVGRAWSAPSPPYRVGFVGRLSFEKGLKTLLHAGSILAGRMREPFELALCGPPELTRREIADPEWQALLEGGREHVRFAGKLTGEALDRFFRSLDVLVLPSTDRIEAFGLVQVEAMMRGVPCVASDRPGMRQPILRTGCGLLFKAGDAGDLAEKIQAVLAGRFPAKPEPHRIRAEFSPDRVVDTYEAMFTALTT